MKEMLVQQKAELQKRGKKGFTLMEMLIVVAIIAVLVAIAIPVFMGQLEKSRAQTDAANIRSGYASAMAQILSDGGLDGAEFQLETTGNAAWKNKASTASTNKTDATVTSAYACQGSATNIGDTNETIGGVQTGTIGWTSNSNIYYYYDATNSKLGIGTSENAAKNSAKGTTATGGGN